MEAVDAMQGQYVDELLDEGGWEEVARAVEFGTPVREARLAAHRGIGQAYGVALLSRHALAQRLQAIEHAALAGALYAYAFLVHRDGVCLGVVALEPQAEVQAMCGLLSTLKRDEGQVSGRQLGGAPHLPVACGIGDGLPFDEQSHLAAGVQEAAASNRKVFFILIFSV